MIKNETPPKHQNNSRSKALSKFDHVFTLIFKMIYITLLLILGLLEQKSIVALHRFSGQNILLKTYNRKIFLRHQSRHFGPSPLKKKSWFRIPTLCRTNQMIRKDSSSTDVPYEIEKCKISCFLFIKKKESLRCFIFTYI